MELPTKVDDILRPRGGMEQRAVCTLLGIHSTKYEEFLFWTLRIWSSTSFIETLPRLHVVFSLAQEPPFWRSQKRKARSQDGWQLTR